MDLNKSIQIISDRFNMRPLCVSDVTERYLGWLRDQTAKQYIVSAAFAPDIIELKKYVQERVERDDVLFLGIFDKVTNQHIGNIKYEPVNSDVGYAIMGILIGEPGWRGKGVATEVLISTASWLKKNRRINQILLGVDRSNIAAIRSYEKAGFIEESTIFIPITSLNYTTMVWRLNK